MHQMPRRLSHSWWQHVTKRHSLNRSNEEKLTAQQPHGDSNNNQTNPRACIMSFAPKPGCPMCGIVSQAQRQSDDLISPPSPLSSSSTSQPDVLWRDDNFTVYRENTNPVSSKGHIIVAFKCVSCRPTLCLCFSRNSPVYMSRPFTCS